MTKVIGIDLGTTNSCVAVMENGEPIIIPNSEGGRTTPSIIAFTKDGERIVGETAKRQAVTNASRTIASIKREMGSSQRIKVDGKKYTPQEISAVILQKLKADAEKYLGEPVTAAVITVPAYFSDSQRQATKDAGRIAGLDVKRIINEPTAAALAYGIDKEIPQKIMVYDLGGGTFDVSILEINQQVIEVLATAGNNRLGGDDFDACIAKHLVETFQKQSGVDLSKDIMAMQRIREAAEKAKVELSSTMAAEINLPFLAKDKHLTVTLTRAEFEAMTDHLVKATMGPVNQAMSDAGLKPEQLGKVLLVGGSTRIPAVQNAVKRFTGAEPSRGINPDECVALGAAIQGGVMIGQVTGLVLLDVTPLSLGIETLGDVFSKIIDRNTTLPVQQSQTFTTAADFQTSVEIHVLQGEREIASCNKTLGKFRLSGIRRAMRGVPQIEVTFSIDTNGIVNVSAKDLGTGKRQEITLTNSSNMSDREIDQAIRDAQTYAAEDALRRQQTETQNRAEHLLYLSKPALKKAVGADRERIRAAEEQVKQAQRNKDSDRLREACDALDEAIKAVGQITEEEMAQDDGAFDAEVSTDDENGQGGGPA